MSDSQFKVGQRVEVTNAPEDSEQHNGCTGEVVAVDSDCLPVLVRFDNPSDDETQWWFEDSALTLTDSVETLEQKRDRLKAELAVAEAELHLARKPQASALLAGTVIGYIDPATSMPALDIKQGPNKWFRAEVTRNRENYLPVTQHWVDYDVQVMIDKAWESGRTLDIYPGK